MHTQYTICHRDGAMYRRNSKKVADNCGACRAHVNITTSTISEQNRLTNTEIIKCNNNNIYFRACTVVEKSGSSESIPKYSMTMSFPRISTDTNPFLSY
mmetsp:Transcript_10622/g.21012  ORF Transcript_10622/g.21012 Transcript_10622/m.21012 type:complete len:99 (+) Transcript_10622:1167-1463(+)